VARILGTLFYAMGARTSDAFIELKAQQALSLGEETFSELVHFILHPDEAEAHLNTRAASRGYGKTDKSRDDWGDDSADAVKPVAVPLSIDSSNLSSAQKKALSVLKKSLKSKPLSAAAGGVLFIDEAHMLDPANNPVGRAIFNTIMAIAEDHRDVLTIILAGYQKDIEQNLYAFDVGMKSRVSDVRFNDYDFHDLRLIWKRTLDKYSDTKSGVHWTCSDDTTSIAVRRVPRGIGRHGFGNGRDLRNAFECAARFARARADFDHLNPTVITEDVIGPLPDESNIPELRSALHDLYALEGLQEVKASVRQLIEMNKRNYILETKGAKTLDIKKNRIFWVSSRSKYFVL
jgi:hypothetical protein